MEQIPYKERFAKQLKERRKACGFDSGKELGIKIGITGQTINNYEKEDSKNTLPDAETLLKLAKALDCTVDYLTLKEEAPKHEAASVAEQTGLCEKAIQTLKWANEAKENQFDKKGKAIQIFVNALLMSNELEKLALSFSYWKEEAQALAAYNMNIPDPTQYMDYDKKSHQFFPKEEHIIRDKDGRIIGYSRAFVEAGERASKALENQRKRDYMEAGARHSTVRGYEQFISEQYRKIISGAKNEKGE